MITLVIKVKVLADRLINKMEKLPQRLEEACEKGLRQITQAAYEEWQNEAGRKLKSTRRRYQDALHYSIDDASHSCITLFARDKSTNWLVSKLEQGVSAFDLKPPRLEGHAGDHWSQLHKTNPGGKKPNPPFVDIPFRTKNKEQGDPNSYRRMLPKSSGWVHPGFKPIGTGGPGPLRPAVIEYIRKQIATVFVPLIARVLV